jgi:hypothetical protein
MLEECPSKSAGLLHLAGLTRATVSMKFNDIRSIIFMKINGLQGGSADWLGSLGDAGKSSKPEMEGQ